MFDVITLGSATFDVFLRAEGMEVKRSDGEREICLRYGAKLEVKEIFFESGGGGTNSAVTFARQGLGVACVVQVGDDFAGKRVIEGLEKEGVETGLIDIEKGVGTDYSTILWAPDGGRTILVYRGKTRLEVEDVEWEKLEAEWFYISSLEGNLEIVEALKLRYPEARIAWNPGGRELKQKEKLRKLIEGIKLLNLNKEEMLEFLGGDLDWSEEKLLEEAEKLPCEYVAITDDRNGAFLWSREKKEWWKSGVYEGVPKIEATGAGDSFGSGLTCGLIKGESLEEMLWRASANASSVVSKVGAKQGILRETELENWKKEELKIEKIS